MTNTVERISTGAPFLDSFLAGGYETNVVTTLYGPSGSGKTNFCLLAAVTVAQQGKKVLFLDTEGGLSVERLSQICQQQEAVLQQVVFLNSYTFEEQKESIVRLRELVNERIGLIIVDSISMLYRVELGKTNEVYDVNAALGQQIAILVEIARKKHIPVLVTTQVYSDFDNRSTIKMVGGDLLRYGSKCLLELQKFNQGWGLTLRKHRSLPEGKEVKFLIVQSGLEEIV